MEQSSIIKNHNIAALGKAWYPTPSANLTGTLTAEGKTIRGTSTLFRTELSVGDYLLNPTNDELQIIEAIDNNTMLHVKEAFTSGLSATTCKRIKNKHLKELHIVFAGTGPGTVRGATQATGGTWPVAIVWSQKNQDGGLDPQLVSAPASTTAHITTVE
jgi:hypothetical protein